MGMASAPLMLSPDIMATITSVRLSPTMVAIMASALLMLSPDIMATMASVRLSPTMVAIMASALLTLSPDIMATMASVLLSPTTAMGTMVNALPEEKKPQRVWDDGEEGAALHSDRPRR